MPTAQTFDQYFSLLGCITAVYVAARLTIKALYWGTVWAIGKGFVKSLRAKREKANFGK